MSLRPGALVIAAACSVGCYWSSPPTQPYPHEPIDRTHVRELAEPHIVGLHSPRVIVLGRFQTLAPEPLGGLYDELEYNISPLYRTYSFPDAEVELFEQTCDALRATGLDVRKDYALADAHLLESRLVALKPVTITAVVLALQHDQVRTEQGRHVEVASLVVRVTVRDAALRERYRKEVRGEGTRRSIPEADVLGALGRSLGAALASDPDFLRAVEATR